MADYTNYKDFLAEELKNPEVKAEYDALETEFEIKRALIKAQSDNILPYKN
ncbi:MAG: hypothetical protein LUE20_04010 [Oscillospiraceae bacterium]|nr:hypothetical protein [Oscillospiraceae bacterium]